VNAGRDIALSGDRVSSSGLLAAKGRLDVNAGELTNGGTAQGSDVTLKGQTVTNSGTLQSAGSGVKRRNPGAAGHAERERQCERHGAAGPA
jgi:adhesin HecA-like repeat protein